MASRISDVLSIAPSLLPTITMPGHTYHCVTCPSTRQDSFGGLQAPPHSQLTQRTLSANSDLSEDSVHIEVRLIFPAMANCNTINIYLISLKQGLNTLAIASEDELLKSGNVAYM